MATRTSQDWFPPELGPVGEREWIRLERQFSLAEGNWVGFVFAASQEAAVGLRSRAEGRLAAQGLAMEKWTPKVPDELRNLLEILLEPRESIPGCVWITAVRTDGPVSRAPRSRSWTAAWDDLFLRLNERREALRASLRCGVVFAGPPQLKPRVREAAPDLWSIRSIVLDLPPMPRPATIVSVGDLIRFDDGFPSAVPDPSTPLAEARRLAERHPNGTAAEVSALLRAVEGLLALSRDKEAFLAAERAVEILRRIGDTGRKDLGDALFALARCAGRLGKTTDGLTTANEALEYWTRRGRTVDPALLALIDQFARAAGDREHAIAVLRQRASQAAVSLAQRVTPATLLEAAVSSERLASTLLEFGLAKEAIQSASDAVSYARRLLAEFDETPRAIRALSVPLFLSAYARGQVGDNAGAIAAYEEVINLECCYVDTYGETAASTYTLVEAYARLGLLLMRDGSYEDAAEAFREASEVQERRVERFGSSQSALENWSTYNLNLGNALAAIGNLNEARESFLRALELWRRAGAETAPTQERALQETYILSRLAETVRATSGTAAALSVFEEFAGAGERALETLGPSRKLLVNFAGALVGLGEARHGSGDLEGASEVLGRAAALARQAGTEGDPDPYALNVLTHALLTLGDVYTSAGRLDDAVAVFESALTTARDFNSKFGPTRETSHALCLSLARLSQARESVGDKETASELNAEYEALCRIRPSAEVFPNRTPFSITIG